LRVFWRWQLSCRTFQGWDDLTSADIAAFMEGQLGQGLTLPDPLPRHLSP
jgi:hypothetical protein